MNDLFFTLGAQIALFFLFLVVKSLKKWRLCAICLSVSLTWITLFTLSKLSLFHNDTLLALLMGESITGLYYLFDKKTKEEWHIFRLPLLLSIFWLFYSGLTLKVEFLSSMLILNLWLVFGLIYFYRRNAVLHGWIEKLIACCRDW